MIETKIASYGAWKSPISSELIVGGTIGVSAPKFDGEDIYWLESRPSEKGRATLVKLSKNGEQTDAIPAPHKVRTRVHEYGGGAFLINKGTIYFSNYKDQRVYVTTGGETPRPLTPESSLRYADFRLDSTHNRLICVAEDHSNPDAEAENKIVSIDKFN